jgi:hypothetical protein
MEMFAYDWEVFPNYALAIFVDVSDYFKIRDEMPENLTASEFEEIIRTAKRIVFHIGFGVNDIPQLIAFVNRNIILGSFNGLDYDDVLLKACIANLNNWKTLAYSNKKLYELSKRIVSNSRNEIYNDDVVNTYKRMRTYFLSVDVQKVFALNKAKKSLKQTLINVKWYNIEDYVMPEPTDEEIFNYEGYELDLISKGKLLHWDRTIYPHHTDGIFWYCLNDTLGTCEIMYQNRAEINLRFDIFKEYGVNVLSSSRSNIADKLFGKFYCEASGIDYWAYSKGRTYRSQIAIVECIPYNIIFKSKEFIALLEELKTSIIVNTKGELNFKTKLGDVEYQMGTGGLHSVDRPAKFIADSEYRLIDADVTSYYPNIVRNLKIAPAHLDADTFINTTSGIIDARIEAKHKKIKVKAEALKIVINVGVFGKMGFEDSAAYDPQAMVSVTIGGQLYLLMLIERLVEADFKIVSANTDGVLTLVDSARYDLYLSICKQWEQDVNFELEYTEYEKYIRTNVNHYFALKKGESPLKERVKYKGQLNPNLFKEELTKGYDKPIIATAVTNYYLDDIPIMETLLESTNILDFCSTQKPGSKFEIELHLINNGEKQIVKLTKDIRFFISNGNNGLLTGLILKNDITIPPGSLRKYTNIVQGKNATILNRIADYTDIKQYNINYPYYYTEAYKLIQAIESNSIIKRVIKKEYGQYKMKF